MAGDSEKGKAAPQLPIGSTFDTYKILRLLGRGGMGEVYEAEHLVLGTHYAIKLLSPALKEQKGFLERFKREAQVMAQLKHPGILLVDDFGETEGNLWLRMELAEGIDFRGKRIVTLGEYSEALGGKISQEELVEYFVQILEGLQYAHQRGAIHRDLKPANILFSSQLTIDNRKLTTVKIADFGLVKLVGEEWVRNRTELSVSMSMSLGELKTISDEAGGTSTRALLGTYDYMSPEQKRGESADERSDIYAVGLITFRLLTGLKEISFKLPSQVDAKLSPLWDKLIMEAVEQNREQRLKSAQEMLKRVKEIKGAVSSGKKLKTVYSAKSLVYAALILLPIIAFGIFESIYFLSTPHKLESPSVTVSTVPIQEPLINTNVPVKPPVVQEIPKPEPAKTTVPATAKHHPPAPDKKRYVEPVKSTPQVTPKPVLSNYITTTTTSIESQTQRVIEKIIIPGIIDIIKK